MFYSHEMLTSPDHGVATIWLVATLGSRSISKKLNRKAILDVDVPKACHVIMDPEAPMALRLQGNLLYGVSRVYSQQCGYALTDVQAMHDKMRTLLKVLPGGGLDPTAGKSSLSYLTTRPSCQRAIFPGWEWIFLDFACPLVLLQVSIPTSYGRTPQTSASLLFQGALVYDLVSHSII
ncbi:Rec8 like protein-domain-containing protein [Aspergillus flavus]|uniref:Rec8 like protein-domain-containing protein n=1 Tax=Aspergillus flavus TaxID=5059 RepID=A0A5N6HD15_ASPFL|nr:Rec8 like protein-domain-containing protein [Aspergillus flavus]